MQVGNVDICIAAWFCWDNFLHSHFNRHALKINHLNTNHRYIRQRWVGVMIISGWKFQDSWGVEFRNVIYQMAHEDHESNQANLHCYILKGPAVSELVEQVFQKHSPIARPPIQVMLCIPHHTLNPSSTNGRSTCMSCAGFQSLSNRTSELEPTKFRPAPPARVESRNTWGTSSAKRNESWKLEVVIKESEIQYT